MKNCWIRLDLTGGRRACRTFPPDPSQPGVHEGLLLYLRWMGNYPNQPNQPNQPNRTNQTKQTNQTKPAKPTKPTSRGIRFIPNLLLIPIEGYVHRFFRFLECPKNK